MHLRKRGTSLCLACRLCAQVEMVESDAELLDIDSADDVPNLGQGVADSESLINGSSRRVFCSVDCISILVTLSARVGNKFVSINFA